MHERRFHADIARLRSPERLARLEVNRVVELITKDTNICRVLDVGTGNGVFAEAFAHAGLDVKRLDANPEMLAAALLLESRIEERFDTKRAGQSVLTIALSYIAGGLIPLAPYMLVANLNSALWVSVGVTLLALFLFGFFKGRFTGLSSLRGDAQTVFIGWRAGGGCGIYTGEANRINLLQPYPIHSF